MLALHDGRTTYADAHDLEVSPGLWSGVGLVRGGAGTSLVGSHDEVAEKIVEYHALGIDEFILSGYPHVEEAWWFGEGVLPRLRARGLLADGPAAGARAGGGLGLSGSHDRFAGPNAVRTCHTVVTTPHRGLTRLATWTT